jgi:hypothetical protein
VCWYVRYADDDHESIDEDEELVVPKTPSPKKYYSCFLPQWFIYILIAYLFI